MKKKRLLAVLMAAAMTFSLAACGSGGSGNASGEGESESGGTQTITMLVQQSRNFDGLQEMIKKLEEDENIVIDVQVVPDDEALNMIKMKLNFGERDSR